MPITTRIKRAICQMEVPSCLSPLKRDIKVGEFIEYTKVVFGNGEHHLVLPNGGGRVPSIFFCTPEEE